MTQNEVPKKTPGRGIYLLPNLLTTAGLFAGFYAVVASMKGQFEPAAIAIFIAMIMDGLDGRVARMTGTQSDFGAEYDSMADIVSFGIAPALVTYNWALADQGKLGWLAAFVFVAGGALRLARFNTQIGIADKKYFQGLAIPSAAAILAGMVWLGVDLSVDGKVYGFWISIVTILLGLAMVSNLRYYSFKEVNWRGKVPFIAVLVIVLVFVLIAYQPPVVLFTVFGGYALSGPIMTLWQKRNLMLRRQKRVKSVDVEESVAESSNGVEEEETKPS
ncbi:CDP-diacylglycerol--serine O-phosphatidyltransferase [Pleionea litopenaei]|uniref:CDP-diacylglycerol--serine O-phosphatidyltransferase n=1 Tax=Pleionea litopenaei TaxID=3070815 RepID=A0AA51RVE8_9GAMM|nr:CDP-diacylglycerol--serine O-phosphatidyltransferase [Pleionea sp. HL-JVS1]WMS88366.1 CDP-diacylglycerol--serine O-phosphatidyltransferase [Pleionea sp. HL-JVS1]